MKQWVEDIKEAGKVVGISFAGASVLFYAFCLTQDKEPEYNQPPIVIEESDTVIKHRQITIDDIKSVCRLNVMNVQVSKETIYTEPYKVLWVDNERVLSAKYFFDVKYSIDLSKLTDNQVLIDGDSIKIYTSEMDIDVSYKEDMTQFKQIEEKGWFVSNKPVSMEPEKYNDGIEQLKNQVFLESKKGIDYNEAIDKAETSVKNAILTLTGQEYNIEIVTVK